MKQNTNSQNPPWGRGTEQPVAVPGKDGDPGAEGQNTDPRNPKDKMTGIPGNYDKTKTSY
jgi:hypothetical protein